jgi:glycosyltransferase involved in cell wall biosynthesis
VIDVRMIRHSGIGTYIRKLVPRVVARRPAWRFTLLGAPEVVREYAWADQPMVDVRESRAGIYTIREQLEIAGLARSAHLLWVPHYNIPVLAGTPLFVTVHDVAMLALPQLAPGLAGRLYAKVIFAAIRRRARGIVFVSDFTRREFERLVGRPRHAATVVHNGVDATWFAEDVVGEPVHRRPYILAVGNLKPHKNFVALIEAFRSIMDGVPHDLVIVGGGAGTRGADPETIAAADTVPDRVVLAGEVDPSELRRYVAGASLFVFPSRYEGFGLPPLEAMAAGTPCVVSTAASVPEVCGDAATYVDPSDSRAIASAIVEVLRSPEVAASLRDRGRRHAATFTWERTADQTVECLDRALAH